MNILPLFIEGPTETHCLESKVKIGGLAKVGVVHKFKIRKAIRLSVLIDGAT